MIKTLSKALKARRAAKESATEWKQERQREEYLRWRRMSDVQREKERSGYLSGSLSNWQWLCSTLAFLLALVAVGTFSGTSIELSPYEQTVSLHTWKWWGFSRVDTPLFWRPDPDSEGNLCWMARDKNGQWYTAIYEAETR